MDDCRKKGGQWSVERGARRMRGRREKRDGTTVEKEREGGVRREKANSDLDSET